MCPPPGTSSSATALSELDWARERVRRMLQQGPDDRLILVAVASVDFAAAIEGRSKRLSSAADRALMFAWREVADVLLVGSRTLTVERYGSLLPPPLERPAWPPIATISRTGDLDFDRILRARTPPALTVYSPVAPPLTHHDVTWRRAPADVTSVVADLRARGARIIVCEGGPTIYAQLVEADLATDFSLTVAPALVGGATPIFHSAMHGEPRPVDTLEVTNIGDHVFVHYALRARR